MLTLTDQIIASIGPSRKAEAIAQGAYSALRAAAVAEEMDPEYEVFFRPPGDDRNHGDQACFYVAWEAGPSGWAHDASGKISAATEKNVKSPQSFSLQFDPRDD